MGNARVKVQVLSRPGSQQDEMRLYLNRVHNCPGAEGDPLKGAVVFPVGHYGFGIPNGQPFAVLSTEPCGGCGKYLRLVFAWKDIKVFDMGASPRG